MDQRQQTVIRTYRGRDLADAQRKAWQDQPEALLAGYYSSGQQWDEAKRTLTVRYVLRAPVEQVRTEPSSSEPSSSEPAPSEPAPSEPAPSEPAPSEPAPTAPPTVEQISPGRPQLRWADNKPLPRWRIVLVLAIIVTLAVGAVIAADLDASDPRPKTVIPAGTDTGAVPRVEQAICRGVRIPGVVLRCGDLIVPEDHARPNGSRIRLHYAVYPADGISTEPDPVVYLDGGPGGSPLTDGFATDPFVLQRDLVVLDQRGTGRSVPTLDCPEIDAVPVDGVEADQALAERTCRDRLRAEGIDRSRYTSAQSAADVEDLRAALGYPAWNLYGISYGSRLALTVMRDHPAGVRTAILDSVYPPDVDGYGEQAANAERAFGAMFAACDLKPACAAAYPHLRQTFDDTVARLDRDQPKVTVTLPGQAGVEVELGGDDLIDVVFQNLYRTEVIPKLPRLISAIAGGDYAALAAHLADGEPPRGRRHGTDTDSEGMELSVQCAEELPFTREEPPPETETRLGRPFGIRRIQGQCALWDVPPAAPIEQEAVTSDIPTLLLAGEFDPVTPRAWADVAARTLSRGHVLAFPATGHGVLNTTSCVDGIVSAFLLEPMAEPDARCIERLPGVAFDVP